MTAGKAEERRLRELSNQISRELSLTDIRLRKVNAELKNAAPAFPLETVASLVTTEFERPARLVIYDISYEFSAHDRHREHVWEASFTLSLSFRSNDITLNDESLKAFGAYGVVEIAHPYARELIHHLTARMRVPSFILEVLPTPRD